MFASYMINTWIAATIIAVVSALIGVLVVLRKESFASHAIPNGAFAGASGALLLGINVFLGLGVFSLLTALSISLNRMRAKADSGTALALVTFLALGSAFISQLKSAGSASVSLLFGQILGVSRLDVYFVALLGIIFLVAFFIFYKKLIFTAVLSEVAAQRGINLKRIEITFLILIAVVTTISVPLVGSILVFSLMIAPAATVSKLAKSPAKTLFYTLLTSVILVWISIILAYQTNWPISFFVAIGGALSYLATVAFIDVRSNNFGIKFKSQALSSKLGN
jgi:zinc/manganese transport system permease protein